MAFIKKSLEELLKESGQYSGKKTYRLIEKNHPAGDIYETKIFANAEDGNDVYVAEKLLSIYSATRKVEVDDKGFPCYVGKLGPFNYESYDIIFLRNTGFACAMGQMHQKKIFEVYNILENTKNPLLDDFQKDVETVINKLDEIKDAYDADYYVNDKTKLSKLTGWEKNAFNFLTSIGGGFAGYKPENHNLIHINLDDKQKVDGISGKTKREALFLHWYKEYLHNNKYPNECIEDTLYPLLNKWKKSVEDKLTKAGFVLA